MGICASCRDGHKEEDQSTSPDKLDAKEAAIKKAALDAGQPGNGIDRQLQAETAPAEREEAAARAAAAKQSRTNVTAGISGKVVAEVEAAKNVCRKSGDEGNDAINRAAAPEPAAAAEAAAAAAAAATPKLAAATPKSTGDTAATLKSAAATPKSTADTAAATAAPAAPAEPAANVTGPKKVEAEMKISGLNYDNVIANTKIHAEIEQTICKAVVDSIRNEAVQAGTPETGTTAVNCEKCVLSRGSVVARAVVSIPSEMNMGIVIKRLEADTTMKTLVETQVSALTGVPGLSCSQPLVSEAEPGSAATSDAGKPSPAAPAADPNLPMAKSKDAQGGQAMKIVIIMFVAVLAVTCAGLTCVSILSKLRPEGGSYRDRKKARAADNGAAGAAEEPPPAPVAGGSYRDRVKNRESSKVAEPAAPANVDPGAEGNAAAATIQGSYRERMKSRTAESTGAAAPPTGTYRDSRTADESKGEAATPADTPAAQGSYRERMKARTAESTGGDHSPPPKRPAADASASTGGQGSYRERMKSRTGGDNSPSPAKPSAADASSSGPAPAAATEKVPGDEIEF